MTGQGTIDKPFVVAPIGRFDRGAAECLRRQLEMLIRTGTVRISVDLEAVESVDVASLAMLLACRKLALRCGGELTISRPNEQVAAVLGMCNLDQILMRCAHPESASTF